MPNIETRENTALPDTDGHLWYLRDALRRGTLDGNTKAALM